MAALAMSAFRRRRQKLSELLRCRIGLDIVPSELMAAIPRGGLEPPFSRDHPITKTAEAESPRRRNSRRSSARSFYDTPKRPWAATMQNSMGTDNSVFVREKIIAVVAAFFLSSAEISG